VISPECDHVSIAELCVATKSVTAVGTGGEGGHRVPPACPDELGHGRWVPNHNVWVIGEILSRYRIVSSLGSGASGEVYRAEDQRLRRPVALKLVQLSQGGSDASKRLLAEARAASALNHPNVAVVYEVDEVEREGSRIGFIAMEYVSGRTLSELAAAERLSLDTVINIGRQIADALSDAHARGLVHRDIKPSNVMVTDAGRVKVLDFGLARWSARAFTGDASTATGDPLAGAMDLAGTLPYMSPEQATGRALDGRSDMFSLGAVLYELLSGKRLFDGENGVQVLEQVLQKEMPRLARRGDDPRLRVVDRIVRRMLEKEPDRRYRDLGEVSVALAAAARGETEAQDTQPQPSVLAVTDFENITANAEDDWLGTGISETITADLRGVEGLAVVPRARVYELVRTLQQQEGNAIESLWKSAGRELGARWVLTGSYQRAGGTVRVTATLLDVVTGQAANTIKVDGALSDIFALQDRLVREVADALRVVTRPEIVQQESGVVGAYEAFSKGVINLRAETYESLDRAVLLFERAVRLDPRYASAHQELGVAYATKADYYGMDELRERAVGSLRRALELQPDSVRAWRELGTTLIWMGREREGFEALERALAIDPSDAGAIGGMARALFVGRAQFEEAARWYERAYAANPKAGWYALQLSHCAALLRQFARGEDAARRAIALQEAFLSGQEGVVIVGGWMRLGHLLALQGKPAQAVDQFRREIEFLGSIDHALRGRIIVELNMRLGAAYLVTGETRKGQALIDVAIEAFGRRVRLGADEPFTRYYAAAAHALKGDADTAIAFLERAASERRAFTLARARTEPEFDGIRTDSRFQRLVG
jgi:serine/threonine protein kinase/tetratricopeptide (TPR) repeat protein